METNTTICCHCRGDPGKCHHRGAHEHGDARDFRRRGEKRRDRRRRAFIDVRRPHVKRHRGDLEAEAGEQEHDAEDQADAALPGRPRDAGEVDGAGKAIDQRSAVKQHARGQRAEDEIFQAGLGRAQRAAVACRHDIERQAHQFEAEIKRNEVGRRNQHQHAKRREQDQHGIFKTLLRLAPGVIDRHGNRGGRAEQRQNFQETRKFVDDEAAAESHQLTGRQHRKDHTGEREQHDRGAVDKAAGVGGPIHAHEQKRHGANAEHNLRQERDQVGKLCGVHRVTALRPAACTAPTAC